MATEPLERRSEKPKIVSAVRGEAAVCLRVGRAAAEIDSRRKSRDAAGEQPHREAAVLGRGKGVG